MKVCYKCGVEKALDEFNKRSKSKDGKQSSCRECKAACNAAWRAENKERKAAYTAAWYAENKERKDAYNAAWRAENKERRAATYAAWSAANPEKVRAIAHRRRARKSCAVTQRWVKRDDVAADVCYWCGSEDVAHLEHLMPIALGGPAAPENEHMACADCNLSKSDKHPLVWIAELVMEGT